jgi:hypothetical protein
MVGGEEERMRETTARATREKELISIERLYLTVAARDGTRNLCGSDSPKLTLTDWWGRSSLRAEFETNPQTTDRMSFCRKEVYFILFEII